ncbi:SCO3374 family protein [Actinacidiphila acidipaludis]|uniref:SCO3374 family protein n=1 Tax=Actinacidiphila acidipaludis TaxID=2873382 RepID=A0ABS7QBH8_9ACTN|nr:SCO3374 family protein [Streptomyces acidipaludis]MBY8880186.1 SCO3374 family protein [Streptomyces acidipaludis]
MGWYEHELGWPVAGTPPGLVTGERFDALDVPAEAGFAMLSRFSRPEQLGPVALDGHRIRLLVAAGSAEELPGLLEWLEWGGVALDLAALGSGRLMRAPAHPEWVRREAAYDRSAPVWLRPPRPGIDVESAVPTLRVCDRADGSGVPIGLTALVAALATACHRITLRTRVRDQLWAVSYASRMAAGTRPRSLTS